VCSPNGTGEFDGDLNTGEEMIVIATVCQLCRYAGVAVTVALMSIDLLCNAGFASTYAIMIEWFDFFVWPTTNWCIELQN
jgi:hypothetical protein